MKAFVNKIEKNLVKAGVICFIITSSAGFLLGYYSKYRVKRLAEKLKKEHQTYKERAMQQRNRQIKYFSTTSSNDQVSPSD